MATLLQIYNLHAEGDELKARVAAAIADAAQDVLNELSATDNHENRLVWAKDSLVNAEASAERMFWGVLGNATIQSSGNSATDGDIQYIVNGLINTFAGD